MFLGGVGCVVSLSQVSKLFSKGACPYVMECWVFEEEVVFSDGLSGGGMNDGGTKMVDIGGIGCLE